MTLDERKALRRRALWDVTDFARYADMHPQAARRLLSRYDSELGGMLLRRSRGTNRRFTFFWALLAKHAPEAFLDDPIETQNRIDAHDELLADVHRSLRMIVAQTGGNTREIERIKRRVFSAA